MNRLRRRFQRWLLGGMVVEFIGPDEIPIFRVPADASQVELELIGKRLEAVFGRGLVTTEGRLDLVGKVSVDERTEGAATL